MSVNIYMDVHIPRAIVDGLRLRGVVTLRAQDDLANRLRDPELLDRATSLGYVLFTHDEDLLVEATQRQRTGVAFGGVLYAHPLKVSIGQCVRDLELVAKAGEPADFVGRVEYLPLR